MTPTSLIDRLEDLARTVRRLVLARGAAHTLVAAVLGVSLLVLVDWLLRLPPLPRVTCLAVVATLTLVIARRSLLGPLLRPVNALDIARRAEAIFPEFQQRLVSALEFARQSVVGSQRMQSLVIQEAAALAATTDLRRVIDPAPLKRSLLVAGAVLVGLIGIAAAIGAENRAIAAARLLDPFGPARWPSVYRLVMTDPAPRLLVEGQPQTLRVQLARGEHPDAAVVLVTRLGDQPAKRTALERVDRHATFAGQLIASLPADVERARVSWWIEAGDDRLPVQTIDLVRPMLLESLEAEIIPPAYLGTTDVPSVDLLRDRARAFVGSTVRLRARFSKPLDATSSPSLAAGTKTVPFAITAEREASVELPAEESLSFTVDARDVDGLSPAQSGPFELDIRVDHPPSVSIEQPVTGERRTAEADLRVTLGMLDDAGITDVLLELRKLGGTSEVVTLPVVEAGQFLLDSAGASWTSLPAADAHIRYRATLGFRLDELAGLSLVPGDRLEIVAVVRDSFDLNGMRHEPVRSRPVVVQILAQDELARDAANRLRDVASRLDRTRLQLDRTAEETRELATDTRDRGRLDDADRSIAARLRQETASAATQARQAAEMSRRIARELAENRSPESELTQLAAEVAQRLDRTADGSLARAREQIGSAMESPQGHSALERAASSQDQAASDLADAVARLGEVGTLRQSLDALEALLAEQRRLAAAAAEALAAEAGRPASRLSDATREQLDRLASQQEQLARAVDEQLDRMEQTADALAQSEPELSQSMRDAARTGRASRVSESQRNAARDLRNNRQQSTRQAQQQAEIGLQTLVDRLNDARTRQLAELSRQLREASEQLEALVARQASHNLDAIGLLERTIDSSLFDELTRLASRPADATLDTDPSRLSTAQGLTERNTRTLARTVSQTREGDQASSRLSRAANQMERALVALRDARLSDAYEPAMVEALAALQDGLAVVSQQQRDVDDQLAQAEQASIRAGFEAVLERQKRLETETIAVEQARDEAGRLDRASALRLARLPDEQAQTRDAASALKSKVEALDSVAFTWLTDRVVDGMQAIRTDLAASKTGRPTLRQHQRVIGDLQRIINALAVQPRDDRFEQASSSGGSGAGSQQQQQRPLPSEAELRLLRGLQDDLSAGTIASAEEDEATRVPRLIELGDDQRNVRELLDTLLRKASRGASGLPPESQDLDDDLIADLLGGDPGDQPDDRMLDRMAGRLDQSRRKLAIDHDPTEPTQAIHRQLLADFDELIDRARTRRNNNSSSSSSSASASSSQQSASSSGASAQAAGNESTSGQSAAATASGAQTGAQPGEAGLAGDQSLEEMAREWGRISPRLRAPVLESRDDQIIDRYRRLTEGYTRAVGAQAGDE